MLLQQPGMLGPLKLKNRVTMAPLGTNFSTSDGLITERDKAYYAERAKGGVAMIMTSAMGITPGLIALPLFVITTALSRGWPAWWRPLRRMTAWYSGS